MCRHFQQNNTNLLPYNLPGQSTYISGSYDVVTEVASELVSTHARVPHRLCVHGHRSLSALPSLGTRGLDAVTHDQVGVEAQRGVDDDLK